MYTFQIYILPYLTVLKVQIHFNAKISQTSTKVEWMRNTSGSRGNRTRKHLYELKSKTCPHDYHFNGMSSKGWIWYGHNSWIRSMTLCLYKTITLISWDWVTSVYYQSYKQQKVTNRQQKWENENASNNMGTEEVVFVLIRFILTHLF